MSSRRLMAPGAAALAASLALAGCFGLFGEGQQVQESAAPAEALATPGEGSASPPASREPMGLPEYRALVQPIADDMRLAGDNMSGVIDDVRSGRMSKAAALQEAREEAGFLRHDLARLRAMTPPPQARDAHQALVGAHVTALGAIEDAERCLSGFILFRVGACTSARDAVDQVRADLQAFERSMP